MAESYGELITRLCQFRDELRRTETGRAVLEAVTRKVQNAAALEQSGISPEESWTIARQIRVTDKEVEP